MPQSHQNFCPGAVVKLLGIMLRMDVGPPLFTQLQSEMPTDGVTTGRYDNSSDSD